MMPFPLSRRLVEVRSCRLRPCRRGVQGFACHAQMTEGTGRAHRRTGGPLFEDARPRKFVARSRGLAHARRLSAIKVDAAPTDPEFQRGSVTNPCRVVRGVLSDGGNGRSRPRSRNIHDRTRVCPPCHMVAIGFGGPRVISYSVTHRFALLSPIYPLNLVL